MYTFVIENAESIFRFANLSLSAKCFLSTIGQWCGYKYIIQLASLTHEHNRRGERK